MELIKIVVIGWLVLLIVCATWIVYVKVEDYLESKKKGGKK